MLIYFSLVAVDSVRQSISIDPDPCSVINGLSKIDQLRFTLINYDKPEMFTVNE